MNFKSHPYLTPAFIYQECQKIAAEFTLQLCDNGSRVCLRDIYKKKGNKCTANRNLLRTRFICNSKNLKYNEKEIKGVYVIVDSLGVPIYVGISQTIIRRLKQHVFGKLNNHATLTYLIARHEYEQLEQKPYGGTRADLRYFHENRERIQEALRTSSVLIKEIDNNFLMYAAEVYLACHFRTKWNCFETH